MIINIFEHLLSVYMNYLTWSNLQNITLNQKRKNNSSSKELNSEQYAPTLLKKKKKKIVSVYVCIYTQNISDI